MDIQTLSEHFAIPGVLSFAATEHGLTQAIVTTPACKAELYLQGAHLSGWQPAGEQPVLFLSERSAFEPGKAIRGGVPIIFPWFGARTAAPNNSRTDGPSHGFARTASWELAFAAVAGEDLHLTLTLGPNDASRALGFDHFQLAYQLILGAELRMSLTVANPGTAPLYFEEALHTYLSVGDAGQISIYGLSDTDFLDKTDGFKRKHQSEPTLTLTGETDRPYLDTVQTVTLVDPDLKRRITVSKSGSKTTVVWNPWSELSAKLTDMNPDGWQKMACIETANAADNALVLQPGGHHSMQAHISVQELTN